MINKNDFIKVGKKKKYKAKCDTCSKDRGYKIKDGSGLCYSCAIVVRNTANPAFINISNPNYIIIKSDKHYRAKCKTCSKDRGYKHKSDLIKDCRSCASSKRNLIRFKHSTPLIQRKLRHSMKSSIGRALKRHKGSKLGASISNVLPYSIPELKSHLETLFQPNMTWENHGLHGWHIDHIKPDSLFTYKTYNDKGFKDSWSLSNLQPLWAEDNLKKSNKY